MADPVPTIQIRVVPRASSSRFEVQPDGSIKVWVTAAPADGQANEAVVGLLSKALGVAKMRLEIVRGWTSRDKTIAVEGLDEAGLRSLLLALKQP